MAVHIVQGDALAVLRGLPSESVNCVVTSPPYYGLRSYGTDPQVWGGDPEHGHEFGEAPVRKLGNLNENFNHRWNPSWSEGGKQTDARPREVSLGAFCPCGAWLGELGHEPTPSLFLDHLMLIFEEVRRVLRSDGTCWVNLGDSYSGSGKGPTGHNGIGDQVKRQGFTGYGQKHQAGRDVTTIPTDARTSAGIPSKNLLLIPERFAIAAQDAGWYVRSQIVWAKKSAMPESVKDRPTSSWEPIWLLTKSRRYWYDADAVRQPAAMAPQRRLVPHPVGRGPAQQNGAAPVRDVPMQDAPENGANLRNVWHLSPEPTSVDHYATYPSEIPRRCILAGCPEGGTVLDPFAGTGTTLLVADRLGRHAIGIELNAKDAQRAAERIASDAPMLAEPVTVDAPAQIRLFPDGAAS